MAEDAEAEKQEDSKKPVNLGRKVFFLDPPYNFVKTTIAVLRMLEYEVYVIADYKQVKPILSLYPDSLLFIYADTILSRRAWLNFIISIQKTPEYKSTSIGIFTKGLTDSQQDDFLKNANIQNGIILLEGNSNTITSAFITKLNEREAKGVRKYVRADCSLIKAAQLYIDLDGKPASLQLMDISSVGCSVQIPKGFTGHLEKNMLIRNASLQLHHGIHVDLLCFATKQDEEYDTAVFLFVQASTNAKNAIREYIAIMMQKDINEKILHTELDEMNYNLPLSKILEMQDPNYKTKQAEKDKKAKHKAEGEEGKPAEEKPEDGKEKSEEEKSEDGKEKSENQEEKSADAKEEQKDEDGNKDADAEEAKKEQDEKAEKTTE